MSDEEFERALKKRQEIAERYREVWGDPDTDVSVEGLDVFSSGVDRALVFFRRSSVVTTLLLGAAGSLALAYRWPSHSFWNLLFIELSSGLAFFTAAPTIIQSARRRRTMVRYSVFFLSLASIVVAHEVARFTSLAHNDQEFIQAALLEFAVALLLLLLLDVALRPWLDTLDQEFARLTARIQSAEAGASNAP